MLRELCVLIVFLATSCGLSSPRVDKVVPTLSRPFTNSSKSESSKELIQNCKNLIRYLNPNTWLASNKNDLDRYFYLAYSNETKGDFDKAILNYRKAAELSDCDCDRLHAEAGEKAAKEAKELFKAKGMTARPTQFFWGRIQKLTHTLPCVTQQ
jgi:tetratricopeptide (TPR) repeat protein